MLFFASKNYTPYSPTRLGFLARLSTFIMTMLLFSTVLYAQDVVDESGQAEQPPAPVPALAAGNLSIVGLRAIQGEIPLLRISSRRGGGEATLRYRPLDVLTPEGARASDATLRYEQLSSQASSLGLGRIEVVVQGQAQAQIRLGNVIGRGRLALSFADAVEQELVVTLPGYHDYYARVVARQGYSLVVEVRLSARTGMIVIQNYASSDPEASSDPKLRDQEGSRWFVQGQELMSPQPLREGMYSLVGMRFGYSNLEFHVPVLAGYQLVVTPGWQGLPLSLELEDGQIEPWWPENPGILGALSIAYSISGPARVSLEIFDHYGSLVHSDVRIHAQHPEGTFVWWSEDLTSEHTLGWILRAFPLSIDDGLGNEANDTIPPSPGAVLEGTIVPNQEAMRSLVKQGRVLPSSNSRFNFALTPREVRAEISLGLGLGLELDGKLGVGWATGVPALLWGGGLTWQLFDGRREHVLDFTLGIDVEGRGNSWDGLDASLAPTLSLHRGGFVLLVSPRFGVVLVDEIDAGELSPEFGLGGLGSLWWNLQGWGIGLEAQVHLTLANQNLAQASLGVRAQGLLGDGPLGYSLGASYDLSTMAPQGFGGLVIHF